jgi:DtxR family Mn-dependent transcriptional regulator
LQVHASSVTGALRALAGKEFIRYAPYEAVTLTETGFDEASRLARRHQILRACFAELLGVDDATAEEAACRMEHGVPPVIVDRMARFHEFIRTLPDKQRQRLLGFAEGCRQEAETAESPIARTTVADLTVGRAGVITAVKGDGSIARRLADMGLGRGALIVVEGIGPMGGPIRVRIRGYRLALRENEAKSIVVVER